jgi:hypothetical protein
MSASFVKRKSRRALPAFRASREYSKTQCKQFWKIETYWSMILLGHNSAVRWCSSRASDRIHDDDYGQTRCQSRALELSADNKSRDKDSN